VRVSPTSFLQAEVSLAARDDESGRRPQVGVRFRSAEDLAWLLLMLAWLLLVIDAATRADEGKPT